MTQPPDDFDLADVELDTEQDTEEFLNLGIEPDIDPALTEPVTGPSADVIKQKRQTARSSEYQKKTRSVLSQAFRATVGQPNTVTDAATILMYEKRFSRAAGDLADESDRFRSTVDFLTSGSESPFAAFAFAALPMVLQGVRNHEAALEPKPRGGIKIPFTKGKRILGGIRLGFRLGQWRNATHEPNAIYNKAFADAGVVRALKEAGIAVAIPNSARD